MQIVPSDFTLPFIRREQIAKDTYSFYFDRTKNPDFDFFPGQYNRMILPHEPADIRGTSRNFSIASSPLDKKELMVTTRIVESSFKKTLYNLTPGTDVQFFGPVGRFIFDEAEKGDRVFIAGGIGITPFRSMLTYVAEKKITIPITLFASFPTVEDFVYFEELGKLALEHSTMRIIYSVTRPEASEKPWNGEVGRISEAMIKKYVPDLSDCITYTCGAMVMVKETLEMLRNMGVKEENLRKENFVGY